MTTKAIKYTHITPETAEMVRRLAYQLNIPKYEVLQKAVRFFEAEINRDKGTGCTHLE